MQPATIRQPNPQLRASRLHNFVERLFETAPDRQDRIRKNPVTGSSFVSELDPIEPQKKAARRAQAARWWFGMCKPGDASDLPVDFRERRAVKLDGLLGWLVAEYSASLECNNYNFRKHPLFEGYASGVMASPLAPDFIKEDLELLTRFPPKPLKGLGRGMVWRPTRRSRRHVSKRLQIIESQQNTYG